MEKYLHKCGEIGKKNKNKQTTYKFGKNDNLSCFPDLPGGTGGRKGAGKKSGRLMTDRQTGTAA
jgi:hypothetical protein